MVEPVEHWITYRSWEAEDHHDRYYGNPIPPECNIYKGVRLTNRANDLFRRLIKKHGMDNWHTQPNAYPTGA